MLLFLRSHFHGESQRVALLKLLAKARIDIADPFEVKALEAPAANALALRLRKTTPEKGSVIVIGSIANESVEDAVGVIEGLRMILPDLAAFPTILLARQSEWYSYGQVAKAPAEIEFFEMPLSYKRMLVLPQCESFTERQYYAVMAQMIPDSFGMTSAITTRGQDRDDTGVMYLDDSPTSQLKRVTDKMLEEAGIKAVETSDVEREDQTGEITLEDRITELPPPPDKSS
jgi:hypothetical protein